MKVLKTIGGIVSWLIVTSLLALFGTRILGWIAGAFNTETTFGSIIFLIITMPVVFGIVFYACLMIGMYFAEDNKSALIILIVCGLWQILTLCLSLTSITTWVVTIATLIGFIIVYIGKLREAKDESKEAKIR